MPLDTIKAFDVEENRKEYIVCQSSVDAHAICQWWRNKGWIVGFPYLKGPAWYESSVLTIQREPTL